MITDVATLRLAEFDAQMHAIISALQARRALFVKDIEALTTARLKNVEDEHDVANLQLRQLADVSAHSEHVCHSVLVLLDGPVPTSHVLTQFM